MQGLQRWQEVLSRYQAGRGITDAEFWDRHVSWYSKSRLLGSRPDVWMPVLSPLAKGGRVLELGPGPGVFTVALSEQAESVVAVEPSGGMIAALRERIPSRLAEKITIVQDKAEQYLKGDRETYDLVVASHSLYNIMPIDRVVADLIQRSPHVVIMMSLDYIYHWRLPLDRHFGTKKRNPSPSGRDFLPLLWEMGVYPDLKLRRTVTTESYADEKALLDWVLYYVGLPEESRAEVTRLIGPFMVRTPDGLALREENREILIRIDRDTNTNLTEVLNYAHCA